MNKLKQLKKAEESLKENFQQTKAEIVQVEGEEEKKPKRKVSKEAGEGN